MKLTSISLAIGVVVTALEATPSLVVGASQSTCNLISGRKADQVCRVELTLEVGGELKVNRDNEDKPVPVKMNVSGKMSYDERLLRIANDAQGLARSVRYYHNAEATLKLGSTTLKPVLRPECRLVAAQSNGSEVTLFCPATALTREELDLIDILGNSLTIDRLLPGKSVAVGDVWTHSPAVCAALLGLDRATESTVQSKLVTIVEGIARVEMNGKVKGVFGGAETQIDLKGKYQVSLAGKQVTWAGLLIKEDRKPGEVSAGVDVVALLQMTVTPISASPRLSDSAIGRVPLTPTDEVTQLSHRSADGIWMLTHDRKWYMNTDKRDMTILRLVEDGQRIAQCNIKTMSKAESSRTPKLSKFEDEVRQALAKNMGKFVESKELSHEAGYRVFRVVATGEVSDLPIQWNYYLVIDDQGRQVVFAFTALKENVDRLAGADRRLVGAFRFSDPKLTVRPGQRDW
jgi:hypothetical protein